jgi:hypothetical protein
MRFLRPWLCSVVLLLGLALIAPVALAQDAAPPDTIQVDDDTVVIQLKDGKQVIVRGGDAPIVLEQDGTFVVGPHGAFRFRGDEDERPHAFFRRFEADHPGFGLFGERFDDLEFDVEALVPDMEPLMQNLDRSMSDVHQQLGGDVRALVEKRAEIARMDAESRRLARQWRQAEGDERERLRADLQELLADIFQQKLDLRQQRIEGLQDKLEEEQAQLERRQAARDEIIDRRLRDLLGEDHELDW